MHARITRRVKIQGCFLHPPFSPLDANKVKVEMVCREWLAGLIYEAVYLIMLVLLTKSRASS